MVTSWPNSGKNCPRALVEFEAPEERLKSPSALVEIGYNEEQSRAEAGRCLDCGINTIFDGERCILCGGCVDVCPTVCLKLVTFDRLAVSPELETATRELGLDPSDLSAISASTPAPTAFSRWV